MAKDNTHLVAKRHLRALVLKMTPEPVVLETHGGVGEMRRQVWRDAPGLMVEKDPNKAQVLAERFPHQTVLCGNSLHLLEADPVWPVPFTIVDIDAYGDPYPAIDHAFACAHLGAFALVVTDGLIGAAKLGTAWSKSTLRPWVQVHGSGNAYKRWPDVVRFLIGASADRHARSVEEVGIKVFTKICYFAFMVSARHGASSEPARKPPRSAKVGDPFYKSAAWRKIRAGVLAASGSCCVMCGKRSGLHVDHVVPRAKGGSDEPENLRVLCHGCHSRVTHAALHGEPGV